MCSGGKYGNDCQMPDFCMAKKYNVDNDGNACPENCPASCNIDEMPCSEGRDWNGCLMPDSCKPIKDADGMVGKDGTDCPGLCPTICGPDEVACYIGLNWNDCLQADICVPYTGDGMECEQLPAGL